MDIAAPASRPGNRPRMLMCYLCGREFGSKSLPIHIPQCQKKWLAEEEKKPKKERRPLPPAPAPEMAIKTGGAQAIDDFNSEAFAAFEQTLEQCPHCQRRFVPKAFKHHSNACTASNPAKPAGTGLIANSLSNRLIPGAVAGSMHGNATNNIWRDPESPPPNLHRKISLYKPSMKEKISDMRAQRVKDGFAPVGRDPGQSSKSGAFCDECGTQYERPESKFCSQCGSKRFGMTMTEEEGDCSLPRNPRSNSPPRTPKSNPQKQEPSAPRSMPAPKSGGGGRPVTKTWPMKKRKEVVTDDADPVEITIKMKVTDD